MGSVKSVMGWFERLFGKKKASIVMVGLDAAGKTTILMKLKLDEAQVTVPTVGFNVETVVFRGVTMHLWDIGGQRRLRNLWRHYYDGTDAIIFVVDSNDPGRFEEARKELRSLLREPLLAGASLLVFCNKQDLPQRVGPVEVAQHLGIGPNASGEGLGQYLAGRKWYVQGCCAQTGEGLFEGLDWLCTHLQNED